MPNENDAKTKLAPKPTFYASLIALAACVCVFAVVALFLQKINETSTENTANVSLKGQKFSLDIADTDAGRIQGLSGRKYLAEDQGMLFVFPAADRQCMWMKDMHISLDMLWLTTTKKVIKIEEVVAPDTYPQQFCADNAQYVIELPAHTAQSTGVQVGEQLDF